MVVVARPYNTQYMRAARAARVCAPSAGCAGMGSPDKGATQSEPPTRAKRRKTVPSAKDLEMVEKKKRAEAKKQRLDDAHAHAKGPETGGKGV